MILSHAYRYIFIKTNKTAGTSVEIALSRYCGNSDIITPVADRDEALRRACGGRPPQNYHAPLSAYTPYDFKRLLTFNRKERYYNHIDAARIRSFVGEEVWNGYYKFCVERNPWDRVLSYYYYRHRAEPRPTIKEFLEDRDVQMLKTWGWHNYTIDGKPAVDRVCLLERLDDDLEEVRLRLGLPERLELPRAKSEFRTDRRSYREVLSDEEAGTIAEMFRDEIALFGYQY